MNLCHWRSPTRTDQISTETVTQIVPPLESTHHVPEQLLSPSVKHDETVPNVLQVSNAIYRNEFPYIKRIFCLFLRHTTVRQRSNYWTFLLCGRKYGMSLNIYRNIILVRNMVRFHCDCELFWPILTIVACIPLCFLLHLAWNWWQCFTRFSQTNKKTKYSMIHRLYRIIW